MENELTFLARAAMAAARRFERGLGSEYARCLYISTNISGVTLPLGAPPVIVGIVLLGERSADNKALIGVGVLPLGDLDNINSFSDV